MMTLSQIADRNTAANAGRELAPGQVFRMGPRYNGSGTYAADNGCGELVRLMRPSRDRLDWYVTRDVEAPLDAAHWDYVVHVSRLASSEFVR